ncbi:hypothetical protein [Cellulosimicrobium marinum]|uniref:hypothetical protein n=1 Tax=Cellulosimicrobium marinum TaxID=1638992 RepID=UPI001E2B60DD|nr:hypothetical protein [Cellulosimicrobium marinum]MCB7135814.1 hypothetical protein [Cellulosimicrobium marinum]
MIWRTTRWTATRAAVLVTAACGVLVGCVGGVPEHDLTIAQVTYRGMPAEGGEILPALDPDEPGIGFTRGADPQTVNVVTVGSSSCPLTPVDVEWDPRERTLAFTFGRRADREHRPCTLDVTPTTSVVHVPDLPADEPVSVVTNAGTIVLPAAR